MPELAVLNGKALRNEPLLAELRTLLARVEAGEVTSMVAIVGTRDHYEHLKSGMTTCEALGALTRGIYAYNQIWDKA